MDVHLIVIENDAELKRARALIDELMRSDMPSDITRLKAQAQLVEAYEEEKWPRRRPSTAEMIAFLMDQHGLKRSDLVPLLGTASRVSEVLRGRRELTMSMVQRLRARFHIPADALLPPAEQTVRRGRRQDGRRSSKEAAA